MGTKVIFRRDKKDGDIVAFFPDEPANPFRLVCYAHVGQHSEADWGYAQRETVPAKPEEYASLQRELVGQGYADLDVRATFRGRH